MKKTIPTDAVLIPSQAECKFKGVIYDVYQWEQELFDETKSTFEMLKRPDTVMAVCIVDDKVLVLKDEQPYSGMRRSFPGGRVDEEDETIEFAAKREVSEETGYEFKKWRLVKVWQPHSKIEWFIYLFIAWEKERSGDMHIDAGEKIDVEQLSFDEVKGLVLDKAGYLGEAKDMFEVVNNIPELLSLPAFEGKGY